MRNILFVIPLLTLIFACEPAEPSIEEVFPKQLDLLEHGVPISIRTPEDAKVINKSSSFMQELKVEGTDFLVYVYGIGAGSMDCQASKGDKLAELKADEYVKFSELIQEDKCGFIYELEAVGDTTKAYNFHYFKVQGNQQYHFTSTAGGRRPPLTLQQIKNMYQAVQPKVEE